MSAFQVSQSHVGAIVRFYIDRNQWHRLTPDDANAIIDELIQECDRSVMHRYSRDNGIRPTLIDHSRPYSSYRVLSPLECLKALACLEYQSCETDDYEQTKAYRRLQTIRAFAISELPGWQAADVWGIPDPD